MVIYNFPELAQNQKGAPRMILMDERKKKKKKKRKDDEERPPIPQPTVKNANIIFLLF